MKMKLKLMRRITPALFSLFFALCVAGCAELSGSDIYADPTTSAGVTADARARLRADEMTARAAFGVRVENGTAILSGMTRDEAARQRALSILRGTPGVFAVDDRTIRP